MTHKRAPTPEINPSAQSHCPPQVDAAPSAPQSDIPTFPPTYLETRDNAIKTDTYRPLNTRWLTLEWTDDCEDVPGPFPPSQSPSVTPDDREPLGHSPRRARPEAPSPSLPLPLPGQPELPPVPKMPELCAAMSDFKESHSDIRVYVKAIFNATNRLVDAKKRIVDVQEYWMEIGLNDLAHDLIPLLDFAERTTPRYTFPPAPNLTAAPVM